MFLDEEAIKGTNIELGSSHSGGTFDYHNGEGFLVCGTSAATHPYVSALNVAYGSGGIVIRNGTSRTDSGDVIGQIQFGSGLEISSASNIAITIDAGTSIALKVNNNLSINGNNGVSGQYWIEVGEGSSSGSGWKRFTFTKGILTAVQ